MKKSERSLEIPINLEASLRDCCQLYFELNKEDMIKFASKLIISKESREEFDRLAVRSWEIKDSVSENCFIAVGEYWDFSLGQEMPDEEDIKFKKICFKLAPSTAIENMGALFLGLNKRWTFRDKFSVDPRFLGFNQGDFLMDHVEEWHAGSPPPVDVYSYVLKILGPKIH